MINPSVLRIRRIDPNSRSLGSVGYCRIYINDREGSFVFICNKVPESPLRMMSAPMLG